MLRSVADGLDCTLVNKFFCRTTLLHLYNGHPGDSLPAIVGVEYRLGLQYAIYVAAVERWPLWEGGR